MADALLEVIDLAVTFHTANGPVQAVKGISYRLGRGETLAVLGESGSGKSVSASAIMNLLDMPPAEIVRGRILYEGRDLLTLNHEERRQINGRKIAMVFQDPLSHLNPVYPVGWQIAETMTAHGRPKREAEARALELVRRVGIPEPETALAKYPHEFSGGQRQRLMIAMALALKPDILIADEPTTALDVTVQAEILQLLEELQAETGMGLLLITHDLGVVAEVADRVVVMNGGEIVEEGEAGEVYRNPKHPYTKKLIDAAPGKGEMRRPEGANEPLLKVRNVSKLYGNFAGLREASFDLQPGETLAIVGESGSGKSTLAKVLMRLEEANSGTAHYKGRDLLAMTPRETASIRREIQMVFQDPTQSLNPRMTVFDLVSEAWVIHPSVLPRLRWRERVGELLAEVGLAPEHMRRYPHQFSGGQRQRIAIARALALEPDLIVCDEAVSALDVSVQAQVIALLERLQREHGIAFVFIAHDLALVRDFADHVLVMKGGHIVEQGTVRQVFETPREDYTRALLAAGLDADPKQQAERRRLRQEGLAAAQ
ncbi:ABC transporter ATP-binding protein [Aureimonas leprariae]|uniref:ABC transporter ATP-binding protein n=1 Tax=Plantimonas leprariae TaxID=2615207 RepID=A0A7V7PK85_9HYPH|nr:ABC transporter ATP-binding protein [Aureimonas leprariae]KAB0676093.1 ABC transporter ATP-binding protein [Aureimonas leprariae]